MGRQILGTFAGFVVMVVFIFATFAVVAPTLGMERLFQPGNWDPSALWLTVSISLSVIGALLGGLTARAVGRADRAVQLLAALVFVMGVGTAIAGIGDTSRGGPRPATATMDDAATRARQPVWIAFLNPVLGAAGVLVGGRVRAKG